MWDRFVITLLMKQSKDSYKRRCGIWMTRKALRARRNKMRMWERYSSKESRSYNDYTEYNRVLNKATKKLVQKGKTEVRKGTD